MQPLCGQHTREAVNEIGVFIDVTIFVLDIMVNFVFGVVSLDCGQNYGLINNTTLQRVNCNNNRILIKIIVF